MKTSFFAFVLGLFFLTSCFNQNKFLVESDYSYQGNFVKYKTFNFVEDASIQQDGNDYGEIRDAIKYQMQIHGYKYTEKKPSLLIFYKIYDNNLTYNGYFQPELKDWVKRKEEASYDPVKYKLDNGTLLIQFVDAKKNQSIWQGYASGILNLQTEKNERFLKNAVRAIFDKYRLFVEGYLAKGKND